MMWKKRLRSIPVLLVANLLLIACGPLEASTIERTLHIGPTRTGCEGAIPKQCLLVREGDDQEWVQHSSGIEGFEHEAGFRYKVKIVEEQAGSGSDEASALHWTLVEVLEKSRAVEGTIWLLSEYTGSDGQTASVLPGSTVTVRFLQGDMGGNASCNSFFGSYELGPEWLKVTPGGMTEMYCSPQELMQQEREFLTQLARSDIYLLEEHRLRILDEDWKLLLTFEPMEHLPLAGILWQLLGYYDGAGGFVPVLNGTAITAEFAEDGRLTGSAGCNSYSGAYEVRNGGLVLGPVSNTELACLGTEGVMEQETAFLSALRSVTGFQVEGNSLVLLNAQGYAILTFGPSGES